MLEIKNSKIKRFVLWNYFFIIGRIKNKLSKEVVSNWWNKFKPLIEEGNEDDFERMKAFAVAQIKPVRIARKTKKEKLILICVVRNDLERIKIFLEYYRNVGIMKFVFIDNNSDDGTKEWLKKQTDVDLYQCYQEYSSAKRVAWINRILSIYGNKRWYLVVDSDEFFTYKGMEERKINNLIDYLENDKIKRIKSIMLDMYGTKMLFGGTENDLNFLQENCYFDKENYETENSKKGVIISGGPRKRLFNQKVWLSKYPLFYLEKKDFLAESHFLYPYEDNFKAPCLGALLHYKFYGQKDLEKVKEAVSKENYANKSSEYKKYLKMIKRKKKLIMFDQEVSVEYVDSNSLSQIELIENINWK